jgi:hypothetical protein
MFRQPPKPIKEALSKPPLAKRFTNIANDLYDQIKKNPAEYDKNIFIKYQVKKYLLKNQEGEPVEAWIFDADSKPFPILENQLFKSAEALIEAAKITFAEEKHPGIAELETLWKGVEAIINDFYKSDQYINEALFAKQVKKGKECIYGLINDILYHWGRTHSNTRNLTEKDYKKFYRDLWKNFEKITPTYKISNIFSVNEARDVNSVQYLERGAHQFDSKDPNKKHYRSPHERDAQGLANYSVYGTGYLTKSKKITITDTGHRHASLPPIDLYKREKKEKLGDGYLQSECIEIAKQNMEDAFKEMQLHAGEMKLEKDKADLNEEKPAKKTKFNLVNVGLLTVAPLDHQDRQYEETILAAELSRSEHPEWNRVSFNFGVDPLAIGHLPLYPDHQKFENQRELFRFEKIFLDQLEFTLSNTPDDNDYKKIFAIHSALAICLDHSKIIEQEVQEEFKKYKKCYIDFLNNPTDDNRKVLRLAKEQFQNFKKTQYDALNSIIEEYKEAYALLQPDIHKHFTALTALREARIKEKSWTEVDELLLFVFKDYDQIHTDFFDNNWQQLEHNFELQTRIITLTTNLQKLAAIYPNADEPTYTEASSNCKSSMDRNITLSAKTDQLRAQRVQDEFDKKRHFSGSAYAQIPANASYGGASKFGRSWKIVKESGHPDPDYAKLQIMATGFAADKLQKSYLKNGALIPKNSKLGLEIQKLKAPTILLDAYNEYLCLHLPKENDIKNKIDKVLANPKEYNPYEFAAEIIQAVNNSDLPKQAFQHFIETIIPSVEEPAHFEPVHNREKSDALLEEKIRPASMSDASSSPSPRSSSMSSLSPEEHKNSHIDETLVQQFRGKEGYKYWLKAINTVKTGTFDRFRLFIGQYNSKSTQAIAQAYQQYCEKPAPDLHGEIEQINLVISAVTAWIDEKHGGSQFEKAKKSSESEQPELRKNSRLPYMEALLEAMMQKKQEKLKAIIEEFTQSPTPQKNILLSPHS